MAWHNFKGKDWSKTRGQLLPDTAPNKRSMKVPRTPYLLQYCLEFGLTKAGAMGAVPMDWPDLVAWLQLMRVTLHPEECRTMIEASRAFTAQVNRNSEENDPAPYSGEI